MEPDNQSAYEAAAEKYTGIIYTDSTEACKDNLEWIKRKQQSPNAVIGFYRPSNDVVRTLFYPPHTSSIQ